MLLTCSVACHAIILLNKLSCIQATVNYVSQFTVETYCFAYGRILFKQPQSVIYHWNQYDEEISKKCRSVCPFVTLIKKPTPPSLLTVETFERAYHPLQENEDTFKKIFFKSFKASFQKIVYCIKCLLFLHYKQ